MTSAIRYREICPLRKTLPGTTAPNRLGMTRSRTTKCQSEPPAISRATEAAPAIQTDFLRPLAFAPISDLVEIASSAVAGGVSVMEGTRATLPESAAEVRPAMAFTCGRVAVEIPAGAGRQR